MGLFIKQFLGTTVWLMGLIFGLFIFQLVVKWQIFDMMTFQAFLQYVRAFLAVYVLFIGMFIFLENRNPYKVISWLLVLTAFPVVGFFLYLAFGRSFRKRKLSLSKSMFSTDMLTKRTNKQSENQDFIHQSQNSLVGRRLTKLLLNNSKSPYFMHNDVEIYAEGHAFFSELIKDIYQAKHHIHMEYFIIRNDFIGNEIKEALIAQAKKGLEVRLIYDSVGCWRLGKAYINALKNAGVQCYAFLPMIVPFLGRELNYRNHRKITVIDGHIGYVGGMNIGDEYMGKHPSLGYWRDSQARISGDAVLGLQYHFLADWTFVSKQLLPSHEYIQPGTSKTESMVQILASGPDSDWETMLQAYFTMVSTAEERIWITTPYLVPEESIMEALKTAALSGVDVRILIPSQPDHFLVYWATRANLEQLLKAGVKIHLYERGFVHSKILLIDHVVASVGTANLDIRSLEINFEINAFLYDQKHVERLANDFLTDLSFARSLDLETHMTRPRWQKVLEALGRVVSPLQ